MIDFDDKIPIISAPEKQDYVTIEEELQKRGWRLIRDDNIPPIIKEYILEDIFSKQFKKLNPNLDELEKRDQDEILDEIKEKLKNDDEKQIIHYIKNGIERYISNKSRKFTFKLIDFDNPQNNDYLLVPQGKFEGTPENIKPDYSLFINGIPIVIIEAKSSIRINSYEEAISQINRYEQESPEFFKFVQIAIAYGDKQVYLPVWPNRYKKNRYSRDFVWKVPENGELKENIFEFLKPETLLQIIKWYTFMGNDKDSKVIARYNQYYASEKVLRRISEYLNGDHKKSGLIWHWQGSGKTYTMIFIANKFFETYFERSPIVFFLVDREDLQKQLLEDFISKLDINFFKKEYLVKIGSIDTLQKELEEISKSTQNQNLNVKKIYVVLIQKFRKGDFEKFIIQGIKKKEILFLIDEAHRSQYGTLASVIKNIFPESMRIAFTGTPIFREKEKNTFKEFGYEDEPYLDEYFIQQSIDDGFTLPIVYDVINEGKKDADGIKLILSDEDIRNFIQSWEELSDEEIDELDSFSEDTQLIITKKDISRHLNSIRIFLTNKKRIEKLASFIADRIKEDTQNFRFKAMIVMTDRKSCVFMKKYLDDVLSKRFGEEAKKWSQIVMTYTQNDTGEILEYKGILKEEWNRDYDEINKAIQDEFKKKEDLRILIVTDMLITGFNAPRLRVIYLDKPLYHHRLLQTIARVNRPYKDELGEKVNGLIVDSVGLLGHLKMSIQTYEALIDEKTAKDLLRNVFYDLDSKVKEFAKTLEDLKKELKNYRIDNQDFSINIELMKSLQMNKSSLFIDYIKTEIMPKINKMVFYWDRIDILRKMHEIIEEFKALGSHKDRIKYEDDVALIQFIYNLILQKTRNKKLPKEFWDQLLELVHNKTEVADFRILSEEIIGKETLEDTFEKIKQKIVSSIEIADAIGVLRAFLIDEIANPVYRAIYERLEVVREEWIKRHDDQELWNQLIKLIEDAVNYKKEIQGLTQYDYITKTVAKAITSKLNINVNLELKEFKTEIESISEKKILWKEEKRKLKTKLLGDLLKEIKIKGIEIDYSRFPELDELADEMIEYTINNIRNERNE